MKLLKLSIVIFSLMACGLLIYGQLRPVPAPDDLRSELMTIADRQVQAEHAIIISGINNAAAFESNNFSIRFRKYFQGQSTQLHRQHQANVRSLHPYIKAETVLNAVQLDVGSNGRTATLTAHESTKLYLDRRSDEATPEYTAYEMDHVFAFIQDGGEWRLNAHTSLDESTVNSSVPPPANAAPVPHSDPVGPQSSAEPRGRSSGDGSFTTRLSSGATFTIQRSKIVEYAYEFWNGNNSGYHVFDNDCTNFASQALAAGGWSYINGYYAAGDVWWHDGSWPVYASYTWAGANNLNQFMFIYPDRAARGNVSDLLPGDILIVDWEATSTGFHTMIVTKKDSSGELYVTYHSNPNRDRKLYSDLMPKYPHALWYAWRLQGATDEDVITKDGFTFTASPTAIAVVQGNTARYILKVQSLDSFSGFVNLSVAGLPNGVSDGTGLNTGSSNQVVAVMPPPNGVATAYLTVTTNPSTQIGKFPITLSATGGLLSTRKIATVELTVLAPSSDSHGGKPSPPTRLTVEAK